MFWDWQKYADGRVGVIVNGSQRNILETALGQADL